MDAMGRRLFLTEQILRNSIKHIRRFNGHFTREPGSAGCPVNFLSFFLDCASDSDWGCFRGCAISSSLGAPF